MMTLGKLLNHWRRSKGWTFGQLAMRSGVSKASLSRWESEQVQPRVRELDSVLDALNLPEVMRLAAFSQIGSARAVARIASSSNRVMLPEQSGDHPWGELPRTGTLLRALRIRAGYTQWEVATLLGIQQSSVARWENSVESPIDEHLQALRTVLNATPDEMAVLKSGPFIRPASSESLARNCPARRHDQLLHGAVFGTWNDADLAFLQLEADLWPSAQKDADSLDLLMEVYATHARFLVWRHRHAEAKRYLCLLRRHTIHGNTARPGLSVPAQTGLLLEAEPAIQSTHRSLSATLRRLIQQQTLFTHREHQAWLYMTLAEGYAVLGRAEEASLFCAQGISTPMQDGRNRSEDPPTLLFRATIYNHIGRPQEALADIESVSRQSLTPAQYTKVAVVRATAYMALGDTAAASDAVRGGYMLIQNYRSVGYKAALDTIAALL